MLKLYSGKRHFMDLVQYGEVISQSKRIDWTPTEGVYAIPGGFQATEEQVRKWANQEGFIVKKCY